MRLRPKETDCQRVPAFRRSRQRIAQCAWRRVIETMENRLMLSGTASPEAILPGSGMVNATEQSTASVNSLADPTNAGSLSGGGTVTLDQGTQQGNDGSPVYDETSNQYFSSIQAAVSAANPNDVIFVSAGTYTENVSISQSLTIDGAGAGSDPTTDADVESAEAGSPVFDITGSGTMVMLNGLYVTGGSVGKSAGVQIGSGASVVISGATVDDPVIGVDVSGTATLYDDTITGNDIGVQVESTGSATIVGCDVSGNTSEGIAVDGGGSATLKGAVTDDSPVGVLLTGAGALVTGGTLTGGGSGTGIEVTGSNDTAVDIDIDSWSWGASNSGSAAQFNNDTITGSDNGIDNIAGSASLDDDTVTATASSAVVDGGTMTIVGTLTSNSATGVLLNAANVSVTGGELLGNGSGDGIDMNSGGDSASEIEIQSFSLGVSMATSGAVLSDVSIGGTTTGVEADTDGNGGIDRVSITGAATGVQVDSGGTADVLDGSITDAGIGIASAGSLTTSGNTISGSTQYGIEIESGGAANIGSQAMNQNTIGLRVDSGAGSVDLTDDEFSDNSTQAIDAEGGTITISGGTISNSDLASTGGGVISYVGTGVLIDGGSVTVTSTNVSDVYIAIDEPGVAVSSLIVGDGTGGDGDTFSNDTTSISVAGGSASIDDNQFTDDGVGIAVTNQGVSTGIAISNNTFAGDTIAAVQIDDGDATVSANTMTGNAIGIDVDGDGNPDLTDNTIAGGSGEVGISDSSSGIVSSTGDTVGGSSGTDMEDAVLYVRKSGAGRGSIDLTADELGFAVTGIDIDGEAARTYGTAIENTSVAINITDEGTTGAQSLTLGEDSALIGDTISDNTTGLVVDSGSVQLNSGTQWTSNNIAMDVDGDGIAIVEGDTFTENATVGDVNGDGQADFINNTLTEDTTGFSANGNGLLQTEDNTITGSSVAIEDASAQAAVSEHDTLSGSTGEDGVEVTGGGTVDLNNDSISGMVVAVSVDGTSTANLTGSTLSDGGAGVQSSGKLSITNGRVIGMHSGGGSKGYGVEVDGGTATISGATIGDASTGDGNVVGIYVSGGTVIVQTNSDAPPVPGILTDNTTGIEVGGGTVTVQATAISGGTTGILVDAGQSVTVQDNSTIPNATTGIDNEGGTAHIDDSTISDDGDGVKNNSETGVSSAIFVGGTLRGNAVGIDLDGPDDSATLDSASTIVVPTGGVGAVLEAAGTVIDGGSISAAGGSNDTEGVEFKQDFGQVQASKHLTIDDPSIGVDVDGTGEIVDDTITSNGIGIKVESGGDATIGSGGVGNDISGNTTYGIEFTAGSAGSVSNNFLQDNGAGLQIDSAFTGSLTVADNNIAGNITAGIDSASPASIDADYNYWGSSSGPTATGNPAGTGDIVSGADITYSPWLTSGTDTQDGRTDGFQPNTTAAVGISGASAGVEGATYVLTLSPSSSTSSWDINWGDGNSIADIQNVPGTTTSEDHVFPEFGNYTISAVAHASGGDVDSNDVSVNVADAPLSATGGVNLTGNEGSPFTNVILGILTDGAGASSNPNDLTVTIDWGDTATSSGTLVPLSGQPGQYDVEGSHTYGEFGNYTIGISVNDDGGQSASTSSAADIANVAPSDLNLSLLSNRIDEGDTAMLSGSFTDPGTGDTHIVDINWGDGSTPDTIVNLPAGVTDFSDVPHQYLDNPTGQPDGSFDIHVTVTDNDNASTSADTSIEVDNVAPTPVIDGAPTGSVPAGTLISLTSTVTDPSPVDQATGFTYQWSVTLNNNPYITNFGPTTGSSFAFTTVLYGNYVVTFSATDKDGGTGTTTAPFTAAEVTPAIPLSGSQTDSSNPTPNDAEGGTFTLTLGPLQDSDLIPGGDTIDQYTILWGDASSATTFTGTQLATLVASGGTVSHVYEDGTTAESPTPNTNVQVFVTLTDGFGVMHSYDPAADGTLGIDVYNVAPTAQLTGTSTVPEGTSGFVQFINQYDPSPIDTAAGFTYEYDFNNSGSFSAPTTSSSATVPASYLSTPGVDTVAAHIFDKDGGFTTDTFQISITNVAPTVNAIGNVNVNQYVPLDTTGSFTDPGKDSPWLVYVNYDTVNNPGLGTLIQSGSSNYFTLSNTYPTPGTYEVTVTVEDLGGPSNNALSLSGSTSFAVDVAATTFQVTQFTPTDSGFAVTFNRQVNTSLLHLYGSTLSGGFGITPDLTIIGTNTGPVAGSLVWDPTTETAEFIKTGGPLVTDTYTVVINSGPDGWLDTNGDQLDGQDNGGTDNYSTVFGITAPSNEAWVGLPDFARGPGQNVVLPAATGTTLPISIYNASGVLSVDFDLIYNPALLNITTATMDAGLPSNWWLTTNFVTPGQINFTISGTSPISGSAINLIDLTASVPNSAPYASAADLQLTNLRVNEGDIPALADSALQKVAYLGDVDGDGTYTGDDAALISRVVVGLDTGFDAYPLTDPVIVGDVTGDGTLSGLDASYVAQKSVGDSVPSIPNLPTGVTPVSAGLDPTLTAGTHVLATRGGTAVLPIDITTNASADVIGITFTVTYDSTVLSLMNSNIALDAQLQNGWAIESNVSDSGSGGAISLYDTFSTGAAAIPTGTTTEISDLTFNIPAHANPGVESVSLGGPTTYGRPALTYSQVGGSIDIPPTFTGNNQYTVALDGSGNVDVWEDVPATSVPTYAFSDTLLSLPNFNIFSFTTTSPGGSLTINAAANGDPLPSGGTVFDATGTGNTLIINADNSGDAFTVGASGGTWAGNPITLANVQNYVFNGGTGDDVLTQTGQPAGTVVFNGGGGQDTLNVDGGDYTFTSDPGAPAGEAMTVNINSSGSAVTFNSTANLAALNLVSGSSAMLNPVAVGVTPNVLITSQLSLAGTAFIDLTDNAMIIHSSSATAELSAVNGLVASGYADGTWTGDGITSSMAASDPNHLTAVGAILNSVGSTPLYSSFLGQAVTTSDVLVRYTYFGDANLDGSVNGSDYTLIDNGFNNNLAGWYNGDFNYDGVVNGDDYTLIDNAFNGQDSSPLGSMNLTGPISAPITSLTPLTAVQPMAVSATPASPAVTTTPAPMVPPSPTASAAELIESPFVARTVSASNVPSNATASVAKSKAKSANFDAAKPPKFAIEFVKTRTRNTTKGKPDAEIDPLSL